MSKSHPGKAKDLAKEPKEKPKRKYTRRAKGEKPKPQRELIRRELGITPPGEKPKRKYTRRAAAVPAAAASPKTDGILDKLKVKADWHRAQAAAIDAQIDSFKRDAEKFLA